MLALMIQAEHIVSGLYSGQQQHSNYIELFCEAQTIWMDYHFT